MVYADDNTKPREMIRIVSALLLFRLYTPAIEFVPHELRTLNILVIDKISSILEPEQKAKYKELGHYDAKVEGMIEDITDYEEGIRERFQDIVNDRADTETIVKDIKNLIKKHSKPLP